MIETVRFSSLLCEIIKERDAELAAVRAASVIQEPVQIGHIKLNPGIALAGVIDELRRVYSERCEFERLYRAEVAERAPVAVEQVDALTDEQITDKFQKVCNEYKENPRGAMHIRFARALIAELKPAAPVQPGAAAIHYPACWDVAAYPTPESALAEVYAWFKCSGHEAAPVQAPEGWQPIESCNQFGPVLLWWRTCKKPSVGEWVDDETGSGWRCEGDQCCPKNQNDCTHWMPLPAAPAPGSAK